MRESTPSHGTQILLVADDARTRAHLRTVLSAHGYHTLLLHTGQHLHTFLLRSSVDLVLLAPAGHSAVAPACRDLRAITSLPFLVVVPSQSGREKIAALDAGADDYLAGPLFDLELLARIRAILRRVSATRPSTPPALHVDGLVIDLTLRRVALDGRSIRLTPKEFDLIQCLIARCNQIIPYADLLRSVWGDADEGHHGTLRVFISSLRRKIERDPARPRYLINEPRIGYRFRAVGSFDALIDS